MTDPKTLTDLSSSERSRMNTIVETSEGMFQESKSKYSEFGLCSNCKSFVITRTEFATVRAECVGQHAFPRCLSAAKPVRDCNMFEDERDMALWEMQQIAYYIDAPPRKAGFINEE